MLARHPISRGVVVALAVGLIVLSACSPSRMAADLAGRAMAGGGGVYASDDDPELVLAALPFGIKTMEGFIAASPANADLRAAAARATAAYAWLLQELEAAREPPGTPAWPAP